MGGRLNWSKGERGSKREGCNLGQDPGNVPSQVTFSPSFQPKLGGVPARADISNWLQDYGKLLGKQEFDPIGPPKNWTGTTKTTARFLTFQEAFEKAKGQYEARNRTAGSFHGFDMLDVTPLDGWSSNAT
jgi:hypothetical protein